MSVYFKFPFENKNWQEVKEIISKDIKDQSELVSTISIFTKFKDHKAFLIALENEDIKTNLFKVLPLIQKEILEMESLFTEKIGLLDKSDNLSETIVLTKRQIRALSCCSFFGLLEVASLKLELQNLINISSIYSGGFHKAQEAAKIQCFINYLYRVFTDMNIDGKISFSKKFLNEFNIAKCDKLIPKQIKVYHDSTSISDLKGTVMTDFANELIGGLVFKGGCVQEEIAFITKPECLISMLFCTRMEENESIHIRGCEQYSKYDGYGPSFSYTGDYVDETEMDNEGYKKTEIIAMDAVPFSFYGKREAQFEKMWIERELVKSSSAFIDLFNTKLPIATGNW